MTALRFQMRKNFFRCMFTLIPAVGILFLPLTLLLIFGEAEHGFDGERDYGFPVLTAESFFNGSFQTDFGNWFSTKYPLRPQVVELYGTIEAKTDFLKFTSKPRRTPDGAAEVIFVEPRFPEYALTAESPVEPDGYRGTAQVVVGKNGYLYENGYINELYGFSKKYHVSDGELQEKADALKSIQAYLTERGAAFLVLITPSKAARLPRYIPDWYLAKFEYDENYIRPYTRFIKMMEDEGINFLDSADLYNGIGLTNVFPKTGTHWTKLAAYETARAAVAEYERQTGSAARSLAADRVITDSGPPGFGTPEKDIFGVAYAGKKRELETAITDGLYYWPNVAVVFPDRPAIPRVFMQGGSFTDDIAYYFSEYEIAGEIINIRYNNGNDADIDWDEIIGGAGLVILETNEQFVYNIGGNAPSFGPNDFTSRSPGNNIIYSLRDYLRKK